MKPLAIHGGSPALAAGEIPAWPAFTDAEERAVQAVVTSGKWWRGSGVQVQQFEREFAAFHECNYALAVANGTQALEIALSCMGVGYEDEVIIPAFTFVATATAVLAVGALPVVVDVEPDTYCIDVAAVRRAITPRTKAIIPVHLAGLPCEMDALLAISRDTGIPILSDSAHAHGARWRGESIAKLSEVSIYSFQSVKLMTAGEGGALVTDSEEIARQAWLKHSYGRPAGDTVYQHLCHGTNSRMTELQGAVLRCQLARLPGLMHAREDASSRLDAFLSGMAGLQVARRYAGVTLHSHYMYMIGVHQDFGVSRNALVSALVAEGLPAYRAYPSIPDLAMFQGGELWNGKLPAGLCVANIREGLNRHPIPNSRRISAQSIWLHHAVLLGGEEVQRKVARAFDKVAAHRHSLAEPEEVLMARAGR